MFSDILQTKPLAASNNLRKNHARFELISNILKFYCLLFLKPTILSVKD